MKEKVRLQVRYSILFSSAFNTLEFVIVNFPSYIKSPNITHIISTSPLYRSEYIKRSSFIRLLMKKLSVFIILGIFSSLIMMFSNNHNILYGQQQQQQHEEEYVNVNDSDKPKFFAIQHAQSGSISEINNSAYSLELNDISDKTILFSDRPDRIVKTANTSDFIDNWSKGVDSFAVDAPNAVLVIDEIKEEQQDIAIIELFNPVYDIHKNSLKYDVAPDNTTSIELPNEFGQSTLVIDIF